MTEPLQVGLDPKPLVEGLATATSALAEFKAAIASLNNTPTAQLKQEMQGLTGAMQTLSNSLEGVFANVGKQVESSMKSAVSAAKAGALEMTSIEEKRIERSQDVNRRATEWFIAEQTKMVGASKAAREQQLQVDRVFFREQDKLAAKALGDNAKLRAASAGKFTTDDYRNLVGIPSREEMKTFATSLRAQMLEDQANLNTSTKLRAASAGKFTTDDYRSLIGAPSREEMKTFATSLRAQMLEDQAKIETTGKLRARSASKFTEDDYRSLIGAPSRTEMASFAARLKADILEREAEAKIVAKAGTTSTMAAKAAETERAAAAAGKLKDANAALRAEMHELHSAARGLASGFGAMWMTWGSILPLMAGAGISAAIVQTVKAGADVQQSLTQIRVLGDETSQSVAGLNSQMLDLAKTGPFGPQEVASAMKTLVLAGLSAKEVTASLKDVLNFSVAGDTGIQQAADTMTTVAKAFGISAEGYGYVGDVISKAAAESKSSVEDMSNSFKTASSINQQFGVSLEDTAVGLALLANAGIKGTAAGTSLRNMVSDLSGRTKVASAALKELGVDAIDKVTGKIKPLDQVMGQLMEKLHSKATPEGALKYLQAIFDERGAKEAYAMFEALQKQVISTGGTVQSVYADLKEKALNAGGFAAIAEAEIALTPMNQMKSVAATLQSTLVETFDNLQPYLIETAGRLKAVFSSEEFKGALQDLVGLIGTLVTYVVEHGKSLATLLLAYSGFRSVVTLLAEMRLAWVAIRTAEVAAAEGAVAVGIATRAATAANPLLLALSAAVSAAAVGWGMYELWMGKATAKTGESFTTAKELLENLKKEEVALDKVNYARLRGLNLKDLEAEENLNAARAEQFDVVAAEQKKLDALKAKLSAGDYRGPGLSILSAKELKDQVDRAEANLKVVKEGAEKLIQEIEQSKGRIQAAARKRDDAIREDMENQKKLAGKLFEGTSKGPTKPATERAQGLQHHADNEMAQIRALESAKAAALKEELADRHKLIAADAKTSLEAQGVYQLDQLNLIKEGAAERLAQLADGRAKEQAQFVKQVSTLADEYNKALAHNKGLDATTRIKGNAKALKDYTDLVKNLVQVESERQAALGINQDAAEAHKQNEILLLYKGIQAEIFNTTEASRKFWIAEADNKEKNKRQDSLDDQLRYASPEARAMLSAVAAEHERLTDKVKAYEHEIEDITVKLEAYNKAAGASLSKEETVQQMLLTDALIAKQTVLNELKGKIPGKEADAGKRALDKFNKDSAAALSNSVADAIVTGLTSGAEAGKKSLRDIIAAELKKPITLEVRALVSTVMGQGGPLQGLGSGGSLGSSALDSSGNILSAGNILGGGGLAGSMMAGAGWVTGSTTFGGALGAGTSLIGAGLETGTLAGTLGGVTSGLGMIAGALGPIALALGALSAIHDSTQGEQRFGGQYGNNGKATNFISGPDGGQIASGNVTKAIDATVSGINATLKTLGSAQSVAYFNAGLESSGSGKGFSYAGGTLTDGAKFGQGFGTGFMNNRGDKSAEQAIAEFGTELKQATLTALQSATDIPKTISDVLRGQDSTAMVDAVTKGLRLTGRDIATLSQDTTKALLATSKDISTLSDSATNDLLTLVSSIQNTVTGFNEAVKALPFDQLKGLSFDAAAGLLAAAGGLERFTTGLNSYYQNFYTAEEKKAQTIQNISRVLTEGGALVSGVMPTTRDAFRKLVEAQDLTTESGQKAYVALLSVGDAFASVTSDVVSSIKKLLDDKAKIEVDLLTAQGNKDAARAAQRAIDIKDFSDAEVAAYDYNQSIKAQIAVLNERKGLQDQLDSVTLTSAQLLDKQRSALDASNQALFDQVQAATAAKKATEDAATAMKDLASANESLKTSRASVTSALKAIKDAAANAANSVVTAQDNITNGYISAQNAVASAQDNLANIAAQAAKAMAGFADSIQQLLTEMATTDLGANSKAGQLAALQADFSISAAQAKAGDAKALGAITSKANALLKEGKAQASTAQDFARLSSSVANTLSDISAAIAPSAAAAEADPSVKAQADLAKAQAELAKWTNAVAVSGASTAKSSSDYLDEWRKATAANTTAQADLLAAQEATKGIELTIADGISGLLDAINTLNDNIAAQATAVAKALVTMTIKGAGGAEAGAANYSGTQVADSIKSMQASGASTAQIVSRASTGFGVASEDLTKVADVVGNTGITAYQKAADSVTALDQATRESVISQANAAAAANSTTPERAVYDYATREGINAAMVDKYLGLPNGASNAWAAANNLPAFDVGTNYVPFDMDARIHEGEMIVPKAYNPSAGGFQNADLEAKVDALNALVAKLLSSTQRNEESNRLTAKILRLVTRDGDGMVINEDTAIPVTVYM